MDPASDKACAETPRISVSMALAHRPASPWAGVVGQSRDGPVCSALLRRTRGRSLARPERSQGMRPAIRCMLSGCTGTANPAGSRSSAAQNSRCGCPPPASAIAGSLTSGARRPTLASPNVAFAIRLSAGSRTTRSRRPSAGPWRMCSPSQHVIAVMCAETLWWRCHRRHRPTEGVRRDQRGGIV